jgi:heme/copper-type cytochrome/quinol oxidase subunit 2
MMQGFPVRRVPPRTIRPAFAGVAVALAALVAGSLTFAAQARRDVEVTARRFAYDVRGTDAAEIRVRQDDLVRVTFSAGDIAHSFTIDEYRINKRAEPDKPVTFEFRADKPGTFLVYCSLSVDERCREETHAHLIVAPK